MGDKGKKDKGRREEQKKGKNSLKEKRLLKKDKEKSSSLFSDVEVKPRGNPKGK